MHEKAFYRAWLPFYQTCWEITRVLQDCGLQLNDEEGHRCYPLEGHLLCHRCHLHRLKTPGPTHPPPSYPLHVTELWTHGLALKKRTVWRQARTMNKGIGLRISTCLGFIRPTREAFIITLIPHHLLPLTFRCIEGFSLRSRPRMHCGRGTSDNSTEHTDWDYDFLCLHRISRHLAHCLRHAPFLCVCVCCAKLPGSLKGQFTKNEKCFDHSFTPMLLQTGLF